MRAIRERRFLYIHNYMPYAPWGQHLNYLWTMKATQAWEQHHKAGKTDAITGRFFGTKPMHELYDTSVDPDNVNNLADDPAFADEVTRLGAALDQWQLDYFDAGLLPETEIVKRAEAAGQTIYDLVRDPHAYDLPRYLKVSARALSQKHEPSDISYLYDCLADQDAGVRYWGVEGLFHIQDRADLDLDLITKSLNDESHHVRAMAAWILYRGGKKTLAEDCWNGLLADSSYASLKILNIIDWIGEGIDPYRDAIAACQFDHDGYVGRMKENMGIQTEPKKPKAKRKK